MVEDFEIIDVEEVDAAYNGWRLDKYLAKVCSDISRARLQQLIKQECVSKNAEIVSDISLKIHKGDVFKIMIPPPEDANPEPENIPLEVVYEDDDLLVINKPAGMTVHPAPGAYRGTLVNALLFHCKDKLSGIGGVKRPGIVHRIDKDTSGLLVVAKNDLTHKDLTQQFSVHSIERTYFAFVYGVPNPMDGIVNAPIGRSPYDRKKMAIVSKGGKSAVTHYKTLKLCGKTASLIQCNLETGRTHQIRVHLSSLGCNLIGDQLYVKNKKSLVSGVDSEVKDYINNFPRQALHAKTLGFIHPRTKTFMQFDSILPKDLQELSIKLHLN
jgi:23S rRNA pseudouridine1911/1915/1917 synthase